MSFKHVTVLATTLAVLAAICGCGGRESRFASHMARGEKYYSQENYAKAAIEFRNAIQIAPNDLGARLMAAEAAEKLGNVRAAALGYQSVIDADADNIAARADLGRLYSFAGVPKVAIDTVAPSLAKHPDEARLLTVRASARAQLQDFKGALEDAERAVRVAPHDEDAVSTLAGLYQQSGDIPRAIQLLQSAIAANTTGSIGLRQVLAHVYESVGDATQAVQQLQLVIRMKPRVFAYRSQLAGLNVRAGRLDEADHVLREAILGTDDPDQAKLAYLNFLSAHRSPARAEEVLRSFVAQEPLNYGLQLELGSAQQRRGDMPAAEVTFKKVIEHSGQSPSGLTARTRLAAIYVAQDKRAEALKLIGEVLRKNANDAEALTLRGDIALQQGDSAAAIVDLRAVLRDQPNSTRVVQSLASAYLQGGQSGLAEELLLSALQSNPTSVELRVDLAQTYAANGRTDRAIELLREGIAADPRGTALRELLVKFCLNRKDFPAAQSAVVELEEARPDAAVGPYLAGTIALAQNHPDEASREFARALQLQPTAIDALQALARLEFSAGRQDDAYSRLTRAIAADPRNAVLHNSLGELYVEGRNLPAAIEQLKLATQFAPKWPTPYRNLALTKLTSGDRTGAISAYEAGVAATGFDPDLVGGLATVYLMQHRVADAIRVFESLHGRNPRLEMASNNLALLLVSYKTDRDSLERARRLTEPFSSSNSAALLDTNGWVRFKCGEYKEALPVLERAAALSPGAKVVLYHLAMAQLMAGQRDKALSNLESSVADGASFMGAEEARVKLAELKEKKG